MSRDKFKLYFRWSLVVIWMIIIFVFSNDPGEVSDNKTGLVIQVLSSIGIDLNSAFGELASFILRKSAHFIEYFILYILAYNAMRTSVSFKKSLFLSLIITFVYASSDEFHQTFVPGREGRLRDVLIDTSGGVFGMIVLYISSYTRRIRKPQ